jgi:hypothetical protein
MVCASSKIPLAVPGSGRNASTAGKLISHATRHQELQIFESRMMRPLATRPVFEDPLSAMSTCLSTAHSASDHILQILTRLHPQPKAMPGGTPPPRVVPTDPTQLLLPAAARTILKVDSYIHI